MNREYVIGCDNAAVAMKDELVKLLKSMDIQVEDVGAFSREDDIYYPLIAEKVCKKISDSGFTKRGILVCGTGIGMAMAANKIKGIYAAVCHDSFSAERSIMSNDANILCMGERVIGIELAKKVLKEWVALEFVDSASTPKVEEIRAIEFKNFK